VKIEFAAGCRPQAMIVQWREGSCRVRTPRRRLVSPSLRERLEGSFAQDLWNSLSAADFGNRIVLFGAAMLLSVLPVVILLSAFASHHVEDDISRHLGLSGRGARVIAGLFRTSGVRFDWSVFFALVLSLAGTVAVARSVQVIYEDAFRQRHGRGPGNLLRCGAWAAAAGALLIVEGAVGKTIDRGSSGPLILGLVEMAGLTLFFWWSLHFLLRGRETWRAVAPAAITTAMCCVGLGAFASLYMSSSIVSDSHLYGTIGVVFSLLTWFIAIGAVLILGSVLGALWTRRRGATV